MPDQPQYFDLSRFALLEVTGQDAFAFLQGQVTGDLKILDRAGWMFSSWCQANGRVICTFILFRKSDALFLLLPDAMTDKITRRLSMYVLRSQVSIRNVSAGHMLLGLQDINIRNTDIFGSCKCTGKMLAAETC
ncbi:MAG: hypothetical protein ACRESK_07620, partial [Gammaproteobacteria bacterium]